MVPTKADQPETRNPQHETMLPFPQNTTEVYPPVCGLVSIQK
jgi:hypothetical protein